MHTAVWHTPQPLWRLALEDEAPHPRFRGPAVLRFDGDAFMDEAQATLATAPETLSEAVARAETWRNTRAGWSDLSEYGEPIKLFQPAHGRYYHDPRPFDIDTGRSLRGYGVGLNWSRRGNVSINLSVAWRDTGPGLSDGGDRNPRVFWSIQKAF